MTPIYGCTWSDLDWYHYLRLWEHLSPDMKRVAELVGVQERFLARAVRGRIPSKTTQQARSVAVHRRFYTALLLQDLICEMSLPDAATKYKCNRGMLQSLQQSAATFAGQSQLQPLHSQVSHSYSRYIRRSVAATAVSGYIRRSVTATAVGTYIHRSVTATAVGTYIRRSVTATAVGTYIHRSVTATAVGTYIRRSVTATAATFAGELQLQPLHSQVSYR